MSGQGGVVREGLREAMLAWAAVVVEPARMLRYGGAPLLAALALQLALGLFRPMPELPGTSDDLKILQPWVDANALPLLAWIILSVWASVRLMVQTTRWAMAGEEGAGWLDPAFGKRELRWLGWSLLVGLALIPAILLMSVIIGILSGLGAVAFGVGSGNMEAGAAQGAAIMGAVGGLVGYAAVAFVMARLMPGLVPVAFDRPAALGESWKKGAAVSGAGTALVYGVMAPTLLLGMVLGGGPLFSPLQTLLTLVSYIAYAALAVAIVRLWYRAGEPGKDS